MAKIDIISGFLGAGKTTLIKKLLKEALAGEQVVLIENEFGEIGIDGGFLQEAGIQITEMNSGCICCSLVGDFGTALKEVMEKYHPDRILIEPSGVGKLSDVIKAVQNVADEVGLEMNSFTAVVDAKKCRVFLKNFGEFFANQIEYAKTVILSRTQNVSQEKLVECVALIREHNDKAAVITTPWDELLGGQILEAMEQKHSLEAELLEAARVCPDCGHVHVHGEHCDHEHHHHHEDECGHEHHHHEDECGHEHHHHHEDECGHEHHHHHEDECGHEHHHHHEDECGHEHHHHHEDECGHEHHHHHEDECGHHHHHGHEGHHHADEVFTSWGVETAHRYTKAEMEAILKELSESERFGTVLRAKGMVYGEGQTWIYFDLVPGEYEVRDGSPQYTGQLCVIGSKIDEDALKELFHI